MSLCIRMRALLTFALLVVFSSITYSQSGQSSAPQAAPQPTPPVLRTTTRLVILDVVTTDDKGNPVSGLKTEDFTVTENGEEQTIADFSFHQAGTISQTANQLPANTISNAPQYSGNSSLNIILLDAINTDFSNHAYAQDMLIKYLDGNPKIQPTAVYALEHNLILLHDFTTDTKALRDALAHYKGMIVHHMETVEAAASPFTQHGTFRNVPQGRSAAFQGMRFLSQALAGYRGRKNLIWISEGFPLSLYPDTSSGDEGPVVMIEDYSPIVEKIADDLMAAQVALYPVSAAGVSKNDNFSSMTAMSSMAQRTGGKTFFNRNDIDTGVRTSMDDGSTYYTLAYYPKNKNWDNKFRHVKVKLNQPGVKLQYRDGYYADNPNMRYGTATMGNEFSQALDIKSPSLMAVAFQAAVVLPSAQTQNRTVVNVGINPHTLAFQRGSDDLEHAHVSCVVWAYPPKGDPIRAEGTYDAALKADEYQQMMKSYFPCRRALDLKPGHYTLRIGVLDGTTNLIGTTNAQVTVP